MITIAVVGAGIFGCVIATELIQKYQVYVDLYDQNAEPLSDTSLVNQCRLHKGYHYPRSLSTMLECKDNFEKFQSIIPNMAFYNADHYYGIAKEKSFLTAEQCEKNWTAAGLEYKSVGSKNINPYKLKALYKVPEKLYDPMYIRRHFKYLFDLLPEINYGPSTKFMEKDIKNYDLVINCTYKNYNQFKNNNQKPLQLELIEKMVVEVPENLHRFSIVVMDGPFMCIDPLPYIRDHSMLGNVEKAIHQRVVGPSPPTTKFDKFIGQGIIPAKDIPEELTRSSEILQHGSEYIPDIIKCKWKGSMYVWRTVLPNHEHDDARPTLINIDNNVINVFSGKFSASIEAWEKIDEYLNERNDCHTWDAWKTRTSLSTNSRSHGL